ncbi:MAG: cysteine peptidase family C39 domain-containing protein [Fimbriimonas sp.]
MVKLAPWLVGGVAAVALVAWMARPKPAIKVEAKPLPLDTPSLRKFVRENAPKKDPKVQDQVGRARLTLAYDSAKKGDFKAARAAFRQTAKEYKGTGGMRADFGGIPDQAHYQAAVCLVADGKPKEAEAEFLKLIKERPLSPLVHAAHGRLKRLNGGEAKREWDDALQTAVAKQEKHIRFETSVCGPKAIARMLPLLGKTGRDYKELARLCGTTDRGTTLEGMRKGLRACGVETYGLEVNRQDISGLTAPFLVLEGDHYVLVTKLEPFRATVYDPRFGSERKWDLPPLDDDQFSATVLTTTLPSSLVSAN